VYAPCAESVLKRPKRGLIPPGILQNGIEITPL